MSDYSFLDNPFPPGTKEYDDLQTVIDPTYAPPDDEGTGPITTPMPPVPPGGGGGGGGDGGAGNPIPPASPAPGPGTDPIVPRNTPPPSGGFSFPSIPGIGAIADAIKSAIGAAAGAAFDGVTSIVGGLRDVTKGLLDVAIPTIGELALGTAKAALSGLDFIADNLTDAVDLGASLAMGIASPFADLLDLGGSMLWGALVRLLQLAADQFDVADALFAPSRGMERLI